MRFIDCEYSIEDLEQFRDQNGFIDLSLAGIHINSSTNDLSREMIGNDKRIKNWVNFNGKKVLIKGQPTDKEQDNGLYAELIVEEMCKELGIETAHYDLVKMIDENGKNVLGVLSESVVDLDKGEYLESLHDIIGDQTGHETDYMVDYEFTIEKLREALLKDGMEESDVEEIIIEYKKRLAFTISVLDEDKHTENISFIRQIVNGKKEIRISPNFDSEASLMLPTDLETARIYLNDIELLESGASSIDPKIGVRKSIDEGGLDVVWMDTLEELCVDDEVYDYWDEVLKEELDMDEIFERVETRINANLPEDVKLLAKYAYKARSKEMQKVMNGEIELVEETDLEAQFLLDFIMGQSVAQGIRTGEQLDIGKKLEQDMELKQEIEKEDFEH